jgi:hypothetical protein
MIRAIRLSCIHALEWYGYRDSIPVEGNLLLAGVTGSGKSILMDLIQFVLVGDQRLVRFNQSATGDRSDRSVKGYCLGDTKQEEGGVPQYMRNAVVTYVALEFAWPDRRKVETWGFRIEFTTAAEAQGHVTPFFVPAAVGRGDFLDEQKRPLDHTAFRAMVESHADADGVRGRVYAELSEYLTHMAQPTHLNFDRSVLRSLLPTAMSFTFLRSFNEFCRKFILPSDRLDVRDVTNSYLTFRRYEHDLTELNDQLGRLHEIREMFSRHQEYRRDAALARYLEAELRHLHITDLLREEEMKLVDLTNACKEEQMRLDELVDELIPRRRAAVDALKNTIHELPGGALYLELKNQNQKLATDIARLKETGRTLGSALAARVRGVREWTRQLSALPLPPDFKTIRAVDGAVDAMESGGISEFGKTLRSLAEIAQGAAAKVSQLAQPTQLRLKEIRSDLSQLREQIAMLSSGRLPFPARLLEALNESLPASGLESPARHLCELCEVRDGEERWRPAIEVAFTRKFAVVVAPEHYDAAEKIYHQLREEAPRESLVNPAKALRLTKSPRAGSLATKLVTTNAVAEAIINHLFGELVCIERREQLREHEAAITPDGFMARGAFVERTRHYDNQPFVGRRGLEQQLAWKKERRGELEAEERRLRPFAEEMEAAQERWRGLFDSPQSLLEDLVRASTLPRLQEELDNNLARLTLIDRAKFDDLAIQQGNLLKEVSDLESEQRRLDRSQKRADLERIKTVVGSRRLEEEKIRSEFERIKAETDISEWLPRLAELRDEICTYLPAKDAAADEFDKRFHDYKEEVTRYWERLKAARKQLAMVYSKFDDLNTDDSSNVVYDKQFDKLSESDIPDYREKAERERQTWEKLFRTQVLEKLRCALAEVETNRLLLNTHLKRPIGNNRYRIVKWENPDFKPYHRMLDASIVAYDGDLFFAFADAELRETCDRFLQTLIDEDKKADAERLLDYRHYYEYDMEVDDLGDDGEVKATSRVDRQSGKFSGGENQSPYFIAILASYLRAYKRHDSRKSQLSLALVPIDEAFSKLSGERIKDCIEALKSLELQGVFSMSTGNIPYAFEHCDSLIIVAKEERRIGKRPQIRNVPVSLHKDSPEARQVLGLD